MPPSHRSTMLSRKDRTGWSGCASTRAGTDYALIHDLRSWSAECDFRCKRVSADVRVGSNCEELNLSKFGPPCLGERTSRRAAATSPMGHEQKSDLRRLQLRRPYSLSFRKFEFWPHHAALEHGQHAPAKPINGFSPPASPAFSLLNDGTDPQENAGLIPDHNGDFTGTSSQGKIAHCLA